MIRNTTLQYARELRGRRLIVAVLTTAALFTVALVAGCSSMQGGATAGGGEIVRTHDTPATIPPPAPPTREWTYDEAPVVPAGLKPHQLLKNLTFASGSASIDAEGQGALMAAAEELKSNTRWHVLAAGFADNRGESASVGQARAEAVMKFLRSQGIDAARISTMGMGTKYAKGRDYEPGQQALDRRVEVWAFMD
jgi:outer membrane protein OmpA-like peptidoglycan-associated protein